jgi:hypothetical protein
MFAVVACCAAEALAFTNLGLIEWVCANLLVAFALIAIYAIRNKRWLSLASCGLIFFVMFGMLIPAIPAEEEVQSQMFSCTKCQACKCVVAKRTLPDPLAWPAPQPVGNSSPIDISTTISDEDNRCLHIWTFDSSSYQLYRRLFGIKWRGTYSVTN